MKKVLALIMLLIVTMNVYAVDLQLTIGSSSMRINGEAKTIKAPVEENGMTLVPVRVITEAFGADVLWNESEQSVVITKNDKRLCLVINNKTAQLNDEKIELLTAPKLLEDTTMVPIRLISVMLDCNVSYNDETREISISDAQKQFWTMDVPKDFNTDTRLANMTVYYNADMSQRITVSMFKKDLAENLQTATEKYADVLKEKYKCTTKVGERIENGLRKGTVGFYYDVNDISFEGLAQIIFSGNVKYILETYSDSGDLDKLNEIANTFKCEPVKEELPDEYAESYVKQQKVNNYLVEASDYWVIENKDDITSVIRDEVNGFEVTLDCINFDTIEDKTVLTQFGIDDIGVFDVSYFYETMYEKIFHKKDGMLIRDVASNGGVTTIPIGGANIQFGADKPNHYKYSMPLLKENFYNKKSVFVFDIDDKSIEYRNYKTNKDGEKELAAKNAIDHEKFDMLVKDRICYVFYIDNCLMIADCKISDYYTYYYNKRIYDDIIKSILKLNM